MTSEEDKYKGYPIIPSMIANNDNELISKMNFWLSYVIEEINKPFKFCHYCDRNGIILPSSIDFDLIKK